MTPADTTPDPIRAQLDRMESALELLLLLSTGAAVRAVLDRQVAS